MQGSGAVGLLLCNCIWMLTFAATNSIEQIPSSEASRSSASQEIPCTWRNSTVHYRIPNSLSSVPILSQINPVHTDSFFWEGIHFIFENCALLSCYAARVVIRYQRFRSTYRYPSSRDKNPKFFAWFLNPWRWGTGRFYGNDCNELPQRPA